jgi:hypothetical protein
MDMSPVVLYSMTCVMRQVAEKKAAAASYARVQEKALRISGATKLQAQKVSHKCTVKALVNEKKEVIKVMKKAQAECADAQSETTRFRVISIPSRSLPLITCRIVSFIRIIFAYDHIFCRNSRSTSRD